MQARQVQELSYKIHGIQLKQGSSEKNSQEFIYQGLRLMSGPEGLNLEASYYVEESYPLPEFEIKSETEIKNSTEAKSSAETVVAEVKQGNEAEGGEKENPRSKNRVYARTRLLDYLHSLENLIQGNVPELKQAAEQRTKTILMILKKYILKHHNEWFQPDINSNEEVTYFKIEFMAKIASQLPSVALPMLIKSFTDLEWMQKGLLLALVTQKGPAEYIGHLAEFNLDLNQALNLKGQAALHLAARNGYFELVKALCVQGARVDQVDKKGWTALCYAFRVNNKIDIIWTLIGAGANLRHRIKNNLSSDRSDKRLTLAHIAARHNHEDLIALLYTHGVTVAEFCYEGISPLYIAARHGSEKVLAALAALKINLDQPLNSKGDTALHIAVSKAHLDAVRVLCARGAKVDIANKQGVLPHSLAYKIEDEDSRLTMIKLLNEASIQQRGLVLKITVPQLTDSGFFSNKAGAIVESTSPSPELDETKQYRI